MIRGFLIIGIFLSYGLSLSHDVKIPDLKSSSWQKNKSTLTFSASNLYGRINGGAELFFEFGFKSLKVQEYVNKKDFLILEVYEMTDRIAALGIYLHKTLKETQVKNINFRNSGNNYQILAIKGSYFVQVTNPSGREECISVMAEIINKLLEFVPERGTLNIFNKLPENDRITGSEGIFRGQLALQSIYTFGSGNIFLLSAKDIGIFADYSSGDLFSYTLLHIYYEASADAEKAFISLVNNLDPYLDVLSNKEQMLTFKDYNNKFGIVENKQNLIQIRINLEELPLDLLEQ